MSVQENAIKTEVNNHFLYPGMLHAQNGQFVITTILGSCVSVCLWDPALKVGGMNHFLLPFWNGEGLQTPKYGNVAIPMLIDKMVSIGCKKANLRAKLFGGANVLANSSGLLNIGERNISLAESTLSEGKISVVSRDVGGVVGRKVMFLTESGDVLVKKVMEKGTGGAE